MSSSLRPLCAAIILAGFMSPALAAETIPTKPLRAASPAPTEKPWTVGVRLDTQGLGIAAAYAVAPSTSLGLYRTSGTEKGLRNNGSDPVSVTALGVELRYYWGGKGLSGKYVFADLAKIDSEFEKPASAVGRVSGEAENGTKPGIGVGYRTRGEQFNFDFGIGYRAKLRYTATYSGSSGGGYSELNKAGNLYAGVNYRF